MFSEDKVSVLINYRDRPTELTLLLESLMFQTYKNFDIYIVDDFSGTNIQNYHFLICIINKMNELGHFVHYRKLDFNHGVSKARNECVKDALKGDAQYFMRVDDDTILEPDYISQLLEVIEEGYDLATGVTPFIGQPNFKRESRFIQPVGDKVILDNEGNIVFNGDDFGIQYLDKVIVPIHHFRSCALYKREIHENVNYDSRLTKHGFREEQIFSFKCIMNGFKLGANTHAIAWHLLTPSGGERFAESQEMIKTNEQVLKDFVKKSFSEKGNFIEEYNKKLGITVKFSKEECLKNTNCQV